ncbi:MAG TPA: hypothetical protein VHT53_11240 [Candidatus Elarobacter sp.]|jgi:hypothetical protein|nr:hypothetical protein [Candidatus Elarobacter sp.]
MDGSSDGRRLAGVLRFLADLSDVAAECAASAVKNDELTARRRLRAVPRGVDAATPKREAKAR